MKIESVLEINLNSQGASGALLPQTQLLRAPRAATVTIPLPEKKMSATMRHTSSLNSLVRAELTGGKSGFDIAENLAFAMILTVTATALIYLGTTMEQFASSLPHFSQFVQGCL